MSTPLQPTLWRTCRVLANRRRLRLFALVLAKPSRTVADLAREARLSVPLASQYLRALEARGLLASNRVRRFVLYRLGDTTAPFPAPPLVGALRRALRSGGESIDRVFRALTAFTHPRRIRVYRALSDQPASITELSARTRISARALARHVRKLQSRGFLRRMDARVIIKQPRSVFARTLARIARNGMT